jgi:arylsulfatase A-like enzyme
MRRRRAQLVSLLGLALLLAVLGHVAGGVAAGSATRPNIVVVITDDQTIHQFGRRVMPHTRSALGDHGTRFTDFMVTSPLCCPSRASFLTGQYAHDHKAWHSFPTLSHPESQLASWLQADGYHTAMIGKYLNGYGVEVKPVTTPAAGWDEWRMLLPPLTYYDYDVSVDGKRVHRGTGRDDYQTSYLGRQSVSLIHRWAPEKDPFFIWLAPHAPHGEAGRSGGACSGRAVPAPEDQGAFNKVSLPSSPSVNEDDIKDKPPYMQGLKRLSHKQLRSIKDLRRCRLESLRGVDREVKRIVQALRQESSLDDTVVVFTSDNGLFEGEHRLAGGKRLPYTEAIRVPFAARFPDGVVGAHPPGRIDVPTANIDLAPTLLQLAGADPCVPESCRVMDGRSWLPLLTGHPEQWPPDRALLNEMHACRYSAMVTPEEAAVLYQTVPIHLPRFGGCTEDEQAERYDLEADPFELDNLAAGPADIPAPTMARLEALRTCRGIAGRDPDPGPGHSYCE